MDSVRAFVANLTPEDVSSHANILAGSSVLDLLAHLYWPRFEGDPITYTVRLGPRWGTRLASEGWREKFWTILTNVSHPHLARTSQIFQTISHHILGRCLRCALRFRSHLSS
ncbi:hypothetical protein CspHIS471_0504150 [Cutaneotrichosporon sp. HIS471]|nr:hypothetical protein CspHIS471_0504150 [Cutaneotrichosporon sp. HIS471]